MADGQNTGALIVLVPAENDPIVAASSEDFAHMTFIWFGDAAELETRDTPEFPQTDIDTLRQEVRQYAAEASGPITVPVRERGTLGDEGADVAFLEPTESLIAFRDGLMLEEQTRSAHDAVEQYPEWTPHVTLGYPEAPAVGEYAGETVTFDRLALWIGDQHFDFPLGGAVGDQQTPEEPDQGALLAAARSAVQAFDMAGIIADVDDVDDPIGAPIEGEMPVDELEEDEELITEVPVHGVATIEGRPTGDGRGFRPGAITFGTLPQPLGYEFEHGHGAANSRVSIVGRIDEYWTVETEEKGVFEARWRGVIFPHKEWGARAIESIIDGSYTGVSVIIDEVTVDITEEREALRERILADRAAAAAPAPEEPTVDSNTEIPAAVLDESVDVEELLDLMIGDGTTPVTWLSSVRVRRFDMVPTGAFIEGYTALGAEFADDMTEEQITASAAALADCGCADSLNQAEAIIASAAGTHPGLKKDGTPPACAYCDETATGYVLHSEGMAYVPFCPEHRETAETDAAASTPDGDPDPSNIDRIGEYAAAITAAAGFAPGTKDGPGWITHPIATSRIRRYWVKGEGAAKIRWGQPGDFNRCRMQLAKYVQNPDWLAGLCANMHKEAIGVWPGQEGGGGKHSLVASAAPLYAMDEAPTALSARLFDNPKFDGPRGIEIEGDRITGYIAVWNVCHIGMGNRCTYAPRSATNYAWFRTGMVRTDEGKIPVGQITMMTGHAGEFLSGAEAAAHYDNTGTAVADVACGEDAYGIWFSGRLRPDVTDDEKFALEASGIVSGDWRFVGGNHELVGGLVVNVGGYPIPNASLVASAAGGGAIIGEGMVTPDVITASAAPESERLDPGALTSEDVADITIRAVEAYVLQTERAAIVSSVKPAREAFAAHQLAEARKALSARIQGV